jgi:hypothetical protein
MARVIIGMDPHKRSATIEIINERETVLAQGHSIPTGTATGRCSHWAASTRNGSGR